MVEFTAIVPNFHNCAVLLFSVVSVAIFSRILYTYAFRHSSGLRVRHLSRCMVAYMAINVVGLVTSAPNYMYQIISGPIIITKDTPEFQSWLQSTAITYLEVMPVAVLFLALERCLAILFVLTSRTETVIFTCNVVCVLTIAIVNLFVYRPIYYSNKMYLFAFKMIVGVLNVCACAFLFWKVRQVQALAYRSESASHTKNTIVKFTCAAELCLEFLPSLIATILLLAGGSSIFAYTGLFASTTQCLNAMICAIIYHRTLHAKNRASVVAVTDTSNV
ncbi:hypothetical protein Ddc_17675 [Ditylenchus destructor]|nr:hypothetical protein Ddc_17675 [Ditylenchus destructor]